MKTSIVTFTAVLALFGGITSCSSGGPTATNNPPPVVIPPQAGSVQYQQLERLATPALKEATEQFIDHSATNTQNPYVEAASSGTLPTDAVNFLTGTAGRSSATVSAIAKVLFPDVVLADLSQTSTTAGYLGVQTAGMSAAGNKFGGRALTDDVIDADLKVIFGPTISALGLAPDDGKESPCLVSHNLVAGETPNNKPQYTSTANVGTSKNQTATFPYMGTPFSS